MHDINFFSPYQKQKITTNPTFVRAMSIGLVVAVVLVAVHLVGFGVKIWASVELRQIQELLNSEDTHNKEALIEEVKKENEFLEKYIGTLGTEKTNLDNVRLIGYALLADISSTLPQPVTFTSIRMDMDECTINFVASAPINVAELEYNLGLLEKIESVHVSDFARPYGDDTTYEGTVTCQLGGVITNE